MLLHELLADLEKAPPVLMLIDEAESIAEIEKFVQRFGYRSETVIGRMHLYRRIPAP